MMTPDIFLLIFGAMLMVTPVIMIYKQEGDDDDNIVRFLMRQDIRNIFLIRAVTLSGFVFFTMGVILLVV